MKIEHPSTGLMVEDIRWPDAVMAATDWIAGKYDPNESAVMAKYLAYAIIGMNKELTKAFKP